MDGVDELGNVRYGMKFMGGETVEMPSDRCDIFVIIQGAF